MSSLRPGIALVICAPSGTGKSTLTSMLLQEFANFDFSISCTTRTPRTGEVDGKHYHFISELEFKQRMQENYFVEWATVYGNYYGSPLAAVKKTLEQGRDLLFDVDVQGAKQIKENLEEAFFIFILPPSRAELQRRLQARGTDSSEVIERRLAAAGQELQQAHWFNALIVNDNISTAYAQVRAAYISATLQPRCQQAQLLALKQQWQIPKEQNQKRRA